MKTFQGYQRGVDLGGWFSQCVHTEAHYDSFISEADIAQIAAWGLDHVRLPIDYDLVETEDGMRIDAGYKRLHTALEWCGRHGLNLVLDLHKTAGYSFDSGEGEDGFFDSHEMQERFYRLWESLATEFVQYGDHVAFELLNEVTDKAFSDKWNAIAAECIARIRKIAPTTSILVGGYWNNSINALPDLLLPPDEHIVYNFHCYEPLIFTHQGAPWVGGMPHDLRVPFPAKTEDYRAVLTPEMPPETFLVGIGDSEYADGTMFARMFAGAVQIAEERDVPLYCGEYGVIDRADNESLLAWYEGIHAAFEQYGIGRAAWSYRRMDYGITDPCRAEIAEKLVSLL